LFGIGVILKSVGKMKARLYIKTREVTKMNCDRRKDFTKKQWKELQKQHRVTNGFNTGTRDMQSEKYPSRNKQKMLDRKEIKEYN
jgi:hypothetical protein